MIRNRAKTEKRQKRKEVMAAPNKTQEREV